MSTRVDEMPKASLVKGDGLLFDRTDDSLTGASPHERAVVALLRFGSVLTMPFGHRGHRLGCAVLSRMLPSRDILVRLNEDAVFSFPFADGYWSRLLNPSYSYEDEIEMLLRAAAPLDYQLVDCGANFGYWSVIASSKAFGSKGALAIEAAPANVRRLMTNNALNGGRFDCLHAAIGRSAGFVRVTGDRHEMHATEDAGGAGENAVQRISIDGLVAAGRIDAGRPTIVKLDVEGVECDAIDGARGLIETDSLFICEEHGNDPLHTVSRHLRDVAKMRVYAFDSGAGRCVEVSDPSVLKRLKRHRWVGYNVFATRSALWEELIRRTTGVGR